MRRWPCTSRINLVGFYPVLLQLMLLNCVKQASISTRVSSSTFTRGQHVCASLLLGIWRHCYAGWSILWALPRISSYIVFCCIELYRAATLWWNKGYRVMLINGDGGTFWFSVWCSKNITRTSRDVHLVTWLRSSERAKQSNWTACVVKEGALGGDRRYKCWKR